MSEISNPLDMDLSSLDTSFPLIKAGTLLDAKIADTSLSSNEAKTLKVTLETLMEHEGQNTGEKIKPGAKLFGNINTEPTGNSNWDIIKRGVAQFVQSTITPKMTIGQLRNSHETLRGQVVTIRVAIKPAKDGFKAGNTISEFIKWKELR